MYESVYRENMGHRRLPRKTNGIMVDFVPRPRPIEAAPKQRAYTVKPWAGRWTPATFGAVATRGAMGDGLPQDAVEGSGWIEPSTLPSNSAPSSAWDTFFSGIAKVATPAAQALLGIKATGVIQQQQQKTMAATWNPTLTNPALQAQAYQNAFNMGTGSSLPISMTTLALLGAGALALFLIAKK